MNCGADRVVERQIDRLMERFRVSKPFTPPTAWRPVHRSLGEVGSFTRFSGCLKLFAANAVQQNRLTASFKVQTLAPIRRICSSFALVLS